MQGDAFEPIGGHHDSRPRPTPFRAYLGHLGMLEASVSHRVLLDAFSPRAPKPRYRFVSAYGMHGAGWFRCDSALVTRPEVCPRTFLPCSRGNLTAPSVLL